MNQQCFGKVPFDIKDIQNMKLLIDEKYRIMDTHNNFLKDNNIPIYIRDYPCIPHLNELSKILKVNIFVYNSIYNITNKIIYNLYFTTIKINNHWH